MGRFEQAVMYISHEHSIGLQEIWAGVDEGDDDEGGSDEGGSDEGGEAEDDEVRPNTARPSKHASMFKPTRQATTIVKNA